LYKPYAISRISFVLTVVIAILLLSTRVWLTPAGIVALRHHHKKQLPNLSMESEEEEEGSE
jgi:hypothetical protein